MPFHHPEQTPHGPTPEPKDRASLAEHQEGVTVTNWDGIVFGPASTFVSPGCLYKEKDADGTVIIHEFFPGMFHDLARQNLRAKYPESGIVTDGFLAENENGEQGFLTREEASMVLGLNEPLTSETLRKRNLH